MRVPGSGTTAYCQGVRVKVVRQNRFKNRLCRSRFGSSGFRPQHRPALDFRPAWRSEWSRLRRRLKRAMMANWARFALARRVRSASPAHPPARHSVVRRAQSRCAGHSIGKPLMVFRMHDRTTAFKVVPRCLASHLHRKDGANERGRTTECLLDGTMMENGLENNTPRKGTNVPDPSSAVAPCAHSWPDS
jgi:hypothetical protein